jgi:formylglycine-generating enzyme required for sulfatase activity
MNPDTFVNFLDRIDPRLPTLIGVVVAVCTVVAVVLKAMKTIREHGWHNLLRDVVLILAVCTSLGVVGFVVYLLGSGALRVSDQSAAAAAPAQLVSAPLGEPPGQLLDPDDLPETLKVSGGIELVLVRPGRYLIGSPSKESGRLRDEEDRRVVVVERPFYIGRTEVTQGQWTAQSGRPNPSFFAPTGEGADKVAGQKTDVLPAEQVTFPEAMAFCTRLSVESEGKWKGWRFMLPTQTQWEIACRAGSETPFHFGAAIGAGDANFDSRTPYGGADKAEPRDRTTPVGTFAANAWGLRDMHGNVAEWCRSDGPQPRAQAGQCVICGGSWSAPGSLCRAAARDWRDPSQRYSDVGFRIAFIFDNP